MGGCPGSRGNTANPVTSGRRNTVAANLLNRLDTQRDDVLRFATDWRVPFDNNLAERDIRMGKLRQKINGCLRTQAGAQAFCTLRSYLSTAAKNGHNSLDALRQLTDGHPWLGTQHLLNSYLPSCVWLMSDGSDGASFR